MKRDGILLIDNAPVWKFEALVDFSGIKRTTLEQVFYKTCSCVSESHVRLDRFGYPVYAPTCQECGQLWKT